MTNVMGGSDLPHLVRPGRPSHSADHNQTRGEHMRRSSGRRASFACALVVAAALVVGAAAPAGAGAGARTAAPIPVGGLGTAVANFLLSPNAVAGANDWDCEPSAAHPDPVVLVHATGVNLGTNWVALAPMLANEGYCVYGFNYGMTWLSAGRVGGLGDIRDSAATLRSFVDRVLRATGAAKVDLVGHSQGGMMPHHYIENLGGAAKVRTFVGISPSNHGTTLSGIVSLGAALNLLGFANAILWGVGVPGLAQQMTTSSFQRQLFGNGDTVPGPRYVVIQTRHDLVVTPYTNAFLQGGDNILVQDQCPNDNVGHVGMFADGPVLQNILNELGPNLPNFRANCTDFGLPV
jgi:triacylglycerol esterase/lipase EstA (alpha/beta hydrolase family)